MAPAVLLEVGMILPFTAVLGEEDMRDFFLLGDKEAEGEGTTKAGVAVGSITYRSDLEPPVTATPKQELRWGGRGTMNYGGGVLGCLQTCH